MVCLTLQSSRNRIVVISTVQTFAWNFVYLRFKNKFKFTESNSLTWLHTQTHNVRQTVSGLITSKKSLFESRMPFYAAPYCSNRTLRDRKKVIKLCYVRADRPGCWARIKMAARARDRNRHLIIRKFSITYFPSLKLKMQPISKVKYVLFMVGKKIL